MALTNDQITAQNFKDFYTQILPYLAPPDLSSYVQKSQTAGLLKNDGTVDTNPYAKTSDIPTAGTGIEISNNTINNTLSSARSGIVDYVFNTRAIIDITMATNETYKPYETFILTSPDDENQPAKVLRFPNNKDFNLYELDGTTTKSVIFNAGTTIIVMLDSTATKALVLAVLDIPNYVKKSSTTGLLKNDGTVDTNSYLADVHFEQTVTLSTSASTTATFTNAAILATSLIDVAVSEWGLVPEDVTVSAGTCTVTLPKVSSAHSVTVRIYVR